MSAIATRGRIDRGNQRRMIKRLLLQFISYRQAEAVKTALALLLYYSGAAWLRSRFRPRGAAILLYHSVSDRDTYWDNRVSPRRFEEQVAYLARRYRVVPLRRIVEALRDGDDVPSDWVAITFDDGYRDNLEAAAPILRRHGASATFFVTADVLKGSQRFFYDEIQTLIERTGASSLTLRLESGEQTFRWHDPASREDAVIRVVLAIRQYPESVRQEILEEIRTRLDATAADGATPGDLYLREDDIDALLSHGMSVGSHTLSHPDLSKLPEGELRRELEESKTFVAAHTGAVPISFSYPYGNFDETVREETLRAGYDCAVTTEIGHVSSGADPFTLPRIGVRDTTLTRLKVGLMGLPL